MRYICRCSSIVIKVLFLLSFQTITLLISSGALTMAERVSMKKTQTLLDGALIFSLFPLSIAFIAGLEAFGFD